MLQIARPPRPLIQLEWTVSLIDAATGDPQCVASWLRDELPLEYQSRVEVLSDQSHLRLSTRHTSSMHELRDDLEILMTRVVDLARKYNTRVTPSHRHFRGRMHMAVTCADVIDESLLSRVRSLSPLLIAIATSRGATDNPWEYRTATPSCCELTTLTDASTVCIQFPLDAFDVERWVSLAAVAQTLVGSLTDDWVWQGSSLAQDDSQLRQAWNEGSHVVLSDVEGQQDFAFAWLGRLTNRLILAADGCEVSRQLKLATQRLAKQQPLVQPQFVQPSPSLKPVEQSASPFASPDYRVELVEKASWTALKLIFALAALMALPLLVVVMSHNI